MTDKDIKRKPHSGQFKSGVSGNPAGRPKKKILTVDTKEFKDNPKKALLYLLNNATNEADVFKYAKALIDYCEPKLSSIQSEIKTEKTITIRIEGFNPIEIVNAGGKIIEGEALSVDEVEAIKASKLEEVKK